MILAALIVSWHVAANAETFKVLSFNVAGIPFVHPDVGKRLRAIGDAIRIQGHDIVGLQEAWLDSDARAVAERAGLPHYARYQREIAFGTGVATLSRFPVAEKLQLQFTCRPSALRAPQGEPIANKGALLTRLNTPWGPLDVYNTHLIANYRAGRYYTLRLTQLFELSEMIETHSKNRPFVVLGDLNADPGQEEFKVFLDLLGLKDACPSCAPTLRNSGRRIDHILLPRGFKPGWVRAETVFRDDAPGVGLPWSDHNAVEATLDRRVLTLRLNPDPRRRAAALAKIEAAIVAMMRAMIQRQARRAWLPAYGFAMTLRYDHQLDQLLDIKARAETARLMTLQEKR